MYGLMPNKKLIWNDDNVKNEWVGLLNFYGVVIKINIFINGIPSFYLECRRGVRQEDPLFPLCLYW